MISPTNNRLNAMIPLANDHNFTKAAKKTKADERSPTEHHTQTGVRAGVANWPPDFITRTVATLARQTLIPCNSFKQTARKMGTSRP